tara:strand:- start:765 stop:1073 length:309 start_codon:yes stop_codon:yes gene_type:complete
LIERFSEVIYLNFDRRLMKIVSLVFQIFLLLIVFGFFLYFLTGYDSAFEADQSCHSYLFNISEQSENLGCDHDTETHQWILYETQDNSEPARIIRKFRYKFL